MVFYQVLDHVFSTWSHIVVLRGLQDSAHGMTGREIARLSKMSHRSCLRALTELEELAVIIRYRGGRDHIFSLNREHVLVTQGILPALRLEREFLVGLNRVLSKLLGKWVESMILFGSVARKQETIGSDLDLCLVVTSKEMKEKVEELIYDAAPEISRQYGVNLAPLFLTVKEFSRKARLNQSPVNRILKEGIVITGKTLRELSHG